MLSSRTSLKVGSMYVELAVHGEIGGQPYYVSRQRPVKELLDGYNDAYLSTRWKRSLILSGCWMGSMQQSTPFEDNMCLSRKTVR